MTSFDPRTWHIGHATPSAPEPVAVAEPGTHPEPVEPARAAWLGFALAASILMGGAVGAYAMRPAEAAFSAAPALASG